MAKIEATVGRVVWFYPDEDSARGKGHPGPLSAQIASVNEDGTINLGVLDHLGVAFAAQNVPLVQEDELIPETAAYAAWMPFQIGQAKKTEEAQRQLADAKAGNETAAPAHSAAEPSSAPAKPATAEEPLEKPGEGA